MNYNLNQQYAKYDTDVKIKSVLIKNGINAHINLVWENGAVLDSVFIKINEVISNNRMQDVSIKIVEKLNIKDNFLIRWSNSYKNIATFGSSYLKSLTESKKEPELPGLDDLKCQHKRKYINGAGQVRFWVCPDCKADLGDA
jgi:hypothetical protein